MNDGDGRAPDDVVRSLVASYRDDRRGQHIDRRFLPSRDEVVHVLGLLLRLLYPGYYGAHDVASEDDLTAHVSALVSEASASLARQIELSIRYQDECREPCPPGAGGADADSAARTSATRITASFLGRLADLRRRLLDDAEAALEGDPAAVNLDEIILAYPGFLATTVYRLAHELHVLGVPLVPRMMTEWAHTQTGADIHPGAVLGERFFLDHATGAVIGETTRIGDDVKMYQGVTLGALSHPRGPDGRVIRGTQRHPTVEDGVTLYANATVLGGDTTIGRGSVLGGSVFVTRTVAAGSRVSLKGHDVRVNARGSDANADVPIDFEI
ncbi:MAG: serine acetyltransferase [Polyangiaceae bacterium]